MHRSGTSCITRILNQNGLSLGSEIIQPDGGNPHGYWENLVVYWINERILRLSNGSWENPPKILYENLYIKIEILRFIYVRNLKNPHLIIKDPRIVLTWHIWKKYLRNYDILAVFRNPNSVAKSLLNRDHMKIEKGLKLWTIYNQKILSISNKEKIQFLNFDNDQVFKLRIKQIIENLNLEFKENSLNFYNPSFKKSDIFEPHLENKIYKKLLKKLN
tara:strand:+ start:2173 stop:2823 length:651 start_codon:yes stop_codon:yes gene_type:complete